MRVRLRRALATLGLGTCLVVEPTVARAAGLYFSDRGVRPLGRGGAFVAGADDLGAIWYNPAGLADAGTSFLLDASWLNFSSTYVPQALVTDANGAQYTTTYPTAKGSTPFLPIPTIGFSFAFGPRKEWTLATGAFSSYTAVASYPSTAQSRYSLISLNGSALLTSGLWLAYKPIEQIRIGAGFELLFGSFATQVAMNSNPSNRVLSAPLDPNYDAITQLTVGPIVAPTGNAGVTIVPSKYVRIGLSGQLPTQINSSATMQVRLPTAVLYDNATVSGNQGTVAFNLPGVLRAGVEVRPIDALRIELAYVRELWSNHEAIDIDPNGITLSGITGFPPNFKVGDISIPRHFQDSNSLRLGGEYGLPIASYVLDLRAGAAIESSAIPPNYESALTVDMNKLMVSLGLGFHVSAHWRFDALYAHIFGETVTTSPATAAVPLINPVQGNPTATTAVNGGTYSAQADVVGVGFNYAF